MKGPSFWCSANNSVKYRLSTSVLLLICGDRVLAGEKFCEYKPDMNLKEYMHPQKNESLVAKRIEKQAKVGGEVQKATPKGSFKGKFRTKPRRDSKWWGKKRRGRVYKN